MAKSRSFFWPKVPCFITLFRPKAGSLSGQKEPAFGLKEAGFWPKEPASSSNKARRAVGLSIVVIRPVGPLALLLLEKARRAVGLITTEKARRAVGLSILVIRPVGPLALVS